MTFNAERRAFGRADIIGTRETSPLCARFRVANITANLCEAYEVKCSARGGPELCPELRDYDPEITEGGIAGATVWCVCPCHRKRTQPPSHQRNDS
jgi:hypothetical protein